MKYSGAAVFIIVILLFSATSQGKRRCHCLLKQLKCPDKHSCLSSCNILVYINSYHRNKPYLISYSVLVYIIFYLHVQYIDFLHYFTFLYLIIHVALLEELRSEEFHCHFYTVAYVHMKIKPLKLENL